MDSTRNDTSPSHTKRLALFASFGTLCMSFACSDHSSVPTQLDRPKKNTPPTTDIDEPQPMKSVDPVNSPATLNTKDGASIIQDGDAGLIVLPTVEKAPSLELILRSSPNAATVTINDVLVGQTPLYWSTTDKGEVHEFVFSKEGYARSHYSFVVTQAGIVHATLNSLPKSVPPQNIDSTRSTHPQ